MGYRSDWRIVFNTCNKQQHVWDTLRQYAASHTSDAAVLLGEMLNSAVAHQDNDVLELADGSWKLPAWDDLTSVLINLFDQDDEIDMAWCRLGEEYDDTEVRHGNYTQIYVERNMDVQAQSVPRAAPVTPPQAYVAVCKCDINQIFRGDGHNEDCLDR